MAVQDNVAPTQHQTLPAPVFVGFPVGGLMLCLLGDNWYSRVFTNDSTLYIRGQPLSS